LPAGTAQPDQPAARDVVPHRCPPTTEPHPAGDSALKYRCLDKCRSPLNFIVGHWQGGHEQAQAFKLGVNHGIFCLGCCWSLMLLMFAIGVGNIGWMLALGTVMAVEKNMPWGRRLSGPLGIVLLGSAVYLIGSGLTG